MFLHQMETQKTIQAPDGIQTHDPPWSSQMLKALSYWRFESQQGWNVCLWLELHHAVT